MFGPSGNVTRLVPADSVVHVRYAVDSARPWHGIAPLAWAASTGALAARLELRLSEEAGAPVGSVIPVPQDGADKSLTELRADLRLRRIVREGGVTVPTALPTVKCQETGAGATR